MWSFYLKNMKFMKTKFSSLLALLCLLTISSSSYASAEKLTSPNGKVILSVGIDTPNETGYGKALFAIGYKDGKSSKSILSKGVLGIETERQKFCELKLRSVSGISKISEDYPMITGKRRHCSNKGVERTYRFENEKKQELQVVFRVYNDGVVFRYVFNGTTNDTDYITNERTAYFVPDGTKRWMQQYTVANEGFFPLITHGEVDKNNARLWGYPALIESQDSIFMLITEAGITKGYSGSRMTNQNNPAEYSVQLIDEKLAFNQSFTSPWRVLIVGSLPEVVESTLVTDVSEPCKLKNTDWVVPGTASWIYWAYNHGSKDYKIVKEYIDLAVDMKWTYNLIDWEWDVMSNGGNMEDAVKYAHSKGIKPLLWYNSGTSWIGPGAPGPLDRLNTRENRRKEFAWLKELGIAGIKVDFFPADGADMMNYYLDILEDAADYQMLINFHGAAIPRGWQRTYPHLMSMEAVYGAEWYNNNAVLTDRAAAHNATLPFTRNVVGSMDYTPGTFSDSQHPHITSYGHELALPVIFESALQHMPDRPSVYQAMPDAIKSFLSTLPAAWDETKLLAGYPGIEVILARRKGNMWYIGGINGTDESRTLSFNPSSLGSIGKTITFFKDGTDDKNFAIETDVPLVNKKSEIHVNCLPRGGFVALISVN